MRRSLENINIIKEVNISLLGLLESVGQEMSLDENNRKEFASNVESAIRYVLRSDILDRDKRYQAIKEMIQTLFSDDSWPIVFIGGRKILDVEHLLRLRSSVSKLKNIKGAQMKDLETVRELWEIHMMLQSVLDSVKNAFVLLYRIKPNSEYGPIALFSAHLNLLEYQDGLYRLESKIGETVNPKNLRLLKIRVPVLDELLKRPDSSKPWVALVGAMVRNEEIVRNAEGFLKLEEIKRMVQSVEEPEGFGHTPLKS